MNLHLLVICNFKKAQAEIGFINNTFFTWPYRKCWRSPVVLDLVNFVTMHWNSSNQSGVERNVRSRSDLQWLHRVMVHNYVKNIHGIFLVFNNLNIPKVSMALKHIEVILVTKHMMFSHNFSIQITPLRARTRYYQNPFTHHSI